MKLSVVIPAFNEEKTIKAVIDEIIVVNDASTDATLKILTNKKNMGHAKSVLRGLKEAKGDYVLYIDSDNQIRPDSVDYDMISGYRIHRQDKLFRKIVSLILKVTIFLRHGYIIKDSNCPFKVIKRASLAILLKRLPKDTIVPSICMEILARKAGMKCIEIPVYHFPYENRTGSLQSINKKSMTMFWKSFLEVIRL